MEKALPVADVSSVKLLTEMTLIFGQSSRQRLFKIRQDRGTHTDNLTFGGGVTGFISSANSNRVHIMRSHDSL